MTAQACGRILVSINKLSTEKRPQLLACLVEGNSIRATARMTGVAVNTVLKFVADVGRACSIYQDHVFRNLTCKRLQCDEIWSFVGAKAKNATPETRAKGWGDVWAWTAIDADTKLVPCWFAGTLSISVRGLRTETTFSPPPAKRTGRHVAQGFPFARRLV